MGKTIYKFCTALFTRDCGLSYFPNKSTTPIPTILGIYHKLESTYSCVSKNFLLNDIPTKPLHLFYIFHMQI